MRVFDLYFIEGLDPLEDVVSTCMNIVNKSVNTYMEEVEKVDNDWSDDPDLLAELLCENSFGTIFSWNLTPEGNGEPVDWYIHSANVDNDGRINFNLDEQTIDGKFGSKTFNRVVKKTVEHESIHLHQEMIMGESLFKSIPSGYMKGMKLLEGSDDKQVLFNEYFADPTEMMAHGHDLAIEILEQNIAIQNLSKNLDKLPTLHRHVHRGFPLDHIVTKRVIEYSNEYLGRMMS